MFKAVVVPNVKLNKIRKLIRLLSMFRVTRINKKRIVWMFTFSESVWMLSFWIVSDHTVPEQWWVPFSWLHRQCWWYSQQLHHVKLRWQSSVGLQPARPSAELSGCFRRRKLNPALLLSVSWHPSYQKVLSHLYNSVFVFGIKSNIFGILWSEKSISL